MPTFNNLKDLEKHLNNKIKNAMQTDVQKVARKTLKENVITEVYDAYSPSQYERTGGLYQDSNIDSRIDETSEGIELSVRSTRNENGRDIAKVIETGKGYEWEDSRIYQSEQARPFHEITRKELEEKGLAKRALKDGLRKQGLDVE